MVHALCSNGGCDPKVHRPTTMVCQPVRSPYGRSHRSVHGRKNDLDQASNLGGAGRIFIQKTNHSSVTIPLTRNHSKAPQRESNIQWVVRLTPCIPAYAAESEFRLIRPGHMLLAPYHGVGPRTTGMVGMRQLHTKKLDGSRGRHDIHQRLVIVVEERCFSRYCVLYQCNVCNMLRHYVFHS